MDKYIIRTSDRKDFKKCRQMWDFGSKMRQDWEPNTTAQPLRFGTAFHAAMEIWYKPETWEWTTDERSNVLAAMAVAEFHKSYPKPLGPDGNPITDAEMVAEWEAESLLGEAMLRNYFAQIAGKETLTPKLVEIEFEVPIVVPRDMWRVVLTDTNFSLHSVRDGDKLIHHVLHYKGLPVYYQGRLDMLAEENGHYYIVDWKTAAKFDPLNWLELEEQITSYAWALQLLLGIRIAGFIYAEFFKGAPSQPKINKNGSLSKDKSQSVTEKTYREAIDTLGLPVGDYEEFLDYLRNNERQYFRRELVQRSQQELEIAGRRIVLEAMEMVNEGTFIYPNPSKMNCNYCAFRSPCVLVNEGGDAEYALNAMFHKRVGSNG